MFEDTTGATSAAPSGLDALGSTIAEIDAAGAPTPEQQREKDAKAKREAAEKELEKEAGEWAQIPFMIGGVAVQIAPELQRFYAPESCMAWGRSAAQVAKKYGWKGTAFPELALAMCTITMAVPTFFIVRDRMRMAAEAKDGGVLKKIALWWRTRKGAQAQPVAAEPAPAAEAAK